MNDLDQAVEVSKILKDRKMNVYPLLSFENAIDDESLEKILTVGGGILAERPEVAKKAFDFGIDRRMVFYPVRGKDSEDSEQVFGTCRFLVENKEELEQIDQVAIKKNQPGYLEEIGVRVTVGSQEENTFSNINVPISKHWIRDSQHTAVRSLFIRPEEGASLKKVANSYFSLVKQFRVDIPCLLHNFVYEGYLEPVLQQDEEVLKSLETVGFLNDTSLYARFFISK